MKGRLYVLAPRSDVAHYADEHGHPLCGRRRQAALATVDDGKRRLCHWCLIAGFTQRPLAEGEPVTA